VCLTWWGVGGLGQVDGGRGATPAVPTTRHRLIGSGSGSTGGGRGGALLQGGEGREGVRHPFLAVRAVGAVGGALGLGAVTEGGPEGGGAHNTT
jgi:hypothetical protein